jgi:hypothetical protein
LSLDDELQRIKKNLDIIAERLDKLEEMIEERDRDRSLLAIAKGGRLGASLYSQSIDVYNRLNRARRVMDDPRLRNDPISQTIIDALGYLGPSNISDITRHVKEVRGTASRTTIRSRIKKLVDLGIIVHEGSGYRLAGDMGDGLSRKRLK